MKGWLIDTNVVSELARSKADTRFVAGADEQPEYTIFISILTIAEFEKGIAA